MIIDSLANAERYFSLHRKFKKAFAYINSIDLSSMEPGKYDVDGDFVIRARRDIDRSEIDVDNKPAAGHAIERLIDIFFREGRRAGGSDDEDEKRAKDHRSGLVELKIAHKFH